MSPDSTIHPARVANFAPLSDEAVAQGNRFLDNLPHNLPDTAMDDVHETAHDVPDRCDSGTGTEVVLHGQSPIIEEFDGATNDRLEVALQRMVERTVQHSLARLQHNPSGEKAKRSDDKSQKQLETDIKQLKATLQRMATKEYVGVQYTKLHNRLVVQERECREHVQHSSKPQMPGDTIMALQPLNAGQSALQERMDALVIQNRQDGQEIWTLLDQQRQMQAHLEQAQQAVAEHDVTRALLQSAEVLIQEQALQLRDSETRLAQQQTRINELHAEVHEVKTAAFVKARGEPLEEGETW